ncbi:MAG: hypothetical protein EXS15_04710 [Phycisphaerales bacterium]|nr:hypothetical protein [Phycisphaerales bacterium]
MSNLRFAVTVTSVVAVTAAALTLAWSPIATTILASGANDQVQPKLSAASNDGFFMSWFDNATGGYDVRANHFDATGTPSWGPNGTLIADRSYSSTVDYYSSPVSGGKLAVAYNDDRLGGDRISVSLLSSTGVILWTSTMPDPLGAYVANPKVRQDPFDGSIYCSWNQGTASKLQKLNPVTGAMLWATPVAIQDGTAQTTNADLWPAADATGGVMVSCVRQVGFTGAKTLKAWRVSPAGVLGWTTGSTAPAVVFSTGSLQIGNYPPCQSIPGVGYVFCWYTSTPLQCSVQFLDMQGVAKFGANGAPVASTTTLERVSPRFAVDAAADRIYVVFPEHVPASSNYGVAAQAFALSGNGARLWGESALSVSPVVAQYSTDFTAATAGIGGATFAWQTSTAASQDSIYSQRVSAAGVVQWALASRVDGATDKGMMMSVRQSSASVFVWPNGGIGAMDIAAQRVGDDGLVGSNPTTPGDVNRDGVVNGADLAAVLAAWATDNADADINNDGIVNGVDLATVLADWQ